MLRVRKDDGTIESFDVTKVIESIRKETGCSGKIIEEIVDDVHSTLKVLKLDPVTGPLIREFVNIKFLEHGMGDCRRKYTRVGMPVYDARKTDLGMGKGDNANLGNSPETVHKRKADQLSKEEALLLLPQHLSEAHLNGYIHIHDLEYITSRRFCADWDARFPLYYGFVGDGEGIHTSVAGPAMRPEVAVLHMVKLLCSGQTQKSIFPDEKILIYDDNGMKSVYISDIVDPYYNTLSDLSLDTVIPVSTNLMAYAFTNDNCIKPQKITGVFRHYVKENTSELITYSGRRVKLTEDHSVFILKNGMIQTIKTTDIQEGDYVVVPVHIDDKYRVCSDHLNVEQLLKYSHIKLYNDNDVLHIERGKSKVNNIIPVNEEFARILGYYIAEGWVSSNGGIEFAFGAEKKSDCVTDLINCAKEIFGDDLSITVTPKKSVLHVRLGSVILSELFSTGLGIGTGSHEKQIPQIILNASNEIKKHFLGSYFCDGHARRREISFKTVSKHIANDICYILLQIGINAHIYYDDTIVKHKINGRMVISGPHYKITISGKDIELLRKYIPDARNGLFPPTNLSVTRPPKSIPIKESGLLDLVKLANKPQSGIYVNVYIKKHISKSHAIKVIESLKNDLAYDTWKQCHDIICGDLGYEPVKCINKLDYSGYVYDIEVNNSHNFIGGLGGICLHNSGGQGLYNFLTFISPYFKNCDYERIKQNIQMFIYEMTQNLVARGSQICFSSVQLSPSVPRMWYDKPAVYKGKIGPETYGEFERENRLLFKAFMEVMIDGDYSGKPFYFPKPEIAFEPEYIEKMEHEDIHGINGEYPSIRDLYLLAFNLAAKFGTPYFDNMIPPYRGAGKGISCVQCCSYNFSSGPDADPEFEDKLLFKDGKHFTMGSNQVITINMPRLAFESDKNYNKLIDLCKKYIDLSVEIFKVKLEWINECCANKMYPFATQKRIDPINGKQSPPLLDYNDYANTLGIVGINEVCEIMLDKPIYEDTESQLFALKLCNELNKYVGNISKLHKIKLALSRTPAETTAQRFAVLDLLNYGDAHKYVKGDVKEAIRKYGETGSRDLPIYYTNGTHCPVDAPISLPEKIRIEQAFFPILDGGNICHIWLGEAYPDPRGLMDMTLKICKSTNLGYFAFTRDFTVCNNGYRTYTG
jgi:ribonucleoside-triphosphate reductase